MYMQATKIEKDTYKNKMVIYRVYHIESNKSYIGKCIDGVKRVEAHFRDCKNLNSVNRVPKLYAAINKYGEDKFKWEIVYIAKSTEELNEKERFFIKEYSSKENGYNLTEGGDGGNTWINLTEEQKEKASLKLSEGQKKHYIGNTERKKKASDTLKKIRNNPEKSAKNAQVCSERMKRLNKDPEFIKKNFMMRAKKAMILENGMVFNSYTEVAKFIGVTTGAIWYSIKNNAKCKGYTVKRYYDVP